jgi:endonuclease YncB( thermonuclease family)
MRRSLLAGLATLALGAAALGFAEAPAADLGGRAEATDGDTLRLGAVEIRLFGIDAPEARQRCARADGSPWDCGRAAAIRLAELIAAGPVRCRPHERDRYGRLVSTCTAGGVDLGGTLVAEGLARAYVDFSDAYLPEEAAARVAGRGLWEGEAAAPWDYRNAGFAAAAGDGGWKPAAGGAAPECAIKGNVSSGGARIYHLPGSPAYARTRIDPARGEAWFCDEAAAVAAGFRPVRRN